jgi:hypothetical protein
MVVVQILIASAIFLCLIGASMAALFLQSRVPRTWVSSETRDLVAHATSLFVVMTSLAMGLMLNSARGTLEGTDQYVHTMATELILLDRTMRTYGPEMDDTRRRLLTYTRQARSGTWPARGTAIVGDVEAETLLDEAERSLDRIVPVTAGQQILWRDARQRMQRVVELRWILVERSEGDIPPAIVGMLVAWLMLIFGSLGYRAPRNGLALFTIGISAALAAGGLYLTLDMDMPFQGTTRVSPQPIDNALYFMAR